MTKDGGQNIWLSLALHRSQDEAVAREIAAIGEQLRLACVAVQPVYTS